MHFFNKHPKWRIVFALIYVLSSVKCVMPISVVTVIIALCWLFGAYIAIVKSGLIKDKNADSISDFSFDFISLEVTAALFLGYFD